MAELTLSIDDDVWRRAHARALDQGRSVEAVVLDFLTEYAGAGVAPTEPVQSLLTIADRCNAGREEARWSRDELNARDGAHASRRL